MIRVVVYEDNIDLRQSLGELIDQSDDLRCVAQFADCMDVENQMKHLQPDIVLMDIDLPGINGIEALKKIRSVHESAQVIMLTVFDDNDRIFESICAGAAGYLLKKSSEKQIVDAIRDARNGGAPMTSSVARQVLHLFASANTKPETKSEINLTKREHETLSLLVKGYSYKMIAVEMQVSIDTVRAHIKKVYEKLQVHSMNEAVAKAIKQRIV